MTVSVTAWKRELVYAAAEQEYTQIYTPIPEGRLRAINCRLGAGTPDPGIFLSPGTFSWL